MQIAGRVGFSRSRESHEQDANGLRRLGSEFYGGLGLADVFLVWVHGAEGADTF